MKIEYSVELLEIICSYCLLIFLARQWETPLHLAAVNGSEDVVRLLIEKGAKVTLKNKQKQSPAAAASTPEVKAIIQQAEFATKIDADVASDDDDEEEGDD